MLILDNYRLYLIYKFFKYIQNYKIKLFILPLNPIYLTQLLNIKYF